MREQDWAPPTEDTDHTLDVPEDGASADDGTEIEIGGEA